MGKFESIKMILKMILKQFMVLIGLKKRAKKSLNYKREKWVSLGFDFWDFEK